MVSRSVGSFDSNYFDRSAGAMNPLSNAEFGTANGSVGLRRLRQRHKKVAFGSPYPTRVRGRPQPLLMHAEVRIPYDRRLRAACTFWPLSTSDPAG
jgi:hypothetical protein